MPQLHVTYARNSRIYERFVKRALDFLIALVVFVLFWWVYVILAILVRVKLGSPVLFTQDRPGKNEKIFKLYKFRTMTDERDENGDLLSDEVRLTKFGKALRSTSLDELPELFNMFRGDMSLIGPRPLLVKYLPLYNEEQRHRHDVRPGLTGWAQVNGRNAISWEEKFKYDVEYARNCTFRMDLRVFFTTFKVLFSRDGINSDTSATMEAFTGTPARCENDNGAAKKCYVISCFSKGDSRIDDISSCFAKRGYTTRIVTSDYDHTTKTRYETDEEDPMFLHVPEYKRNISFARIISHKTFSNKTRDLLNRDKPDVVVCRFPPNSLVKTCAKYCHRFDKTLIFDCYDLWPESFPYSDFLLLKPLARFWRILRDGYLENASLVLTASKVKSNYLSGIHSNINIETVLPTSNFDCTPRACQIDPMSKISFCYLGNINHILDIELCVSILSYVAKSRETELHLIGEGEALPQLRAKLKESGVKLVEHGVVFDSSEKSAIYASSHFGLNLPKRSTEVTLSLKSVEYLKAGLPMINAAPGDNANFIEQYGCGLNVSAADAASVSQKILDMDIAAIYLMQQGCAECYSAVFESQNMDEVLFRGEE